MAEWQILQDAVSVRGVHDGGFSETATVFGIFALQQVAFARVRAHDFAGAGDLEPLGHGFLRFDAFGTSHKFISIAKGRALYAAA
jgi:hypothetical protein